MAARGRTKGFVMGPEHRSKIGNSKVLGELIRFAEGKIPPDEYPPHRVTASLGLLRKVMADQTEIEHGGKIQTEETGQGAAKLAAFLDAISSRTPSDTDA